MQRIVDMGVVLHLNTKVTDLARTMEDGRFDAVFLAVGAHIAKAGVHPGQDGSRILDAVQVLHSMEGEEQPMLGRRVVVYGGGNTAIDVARTAKRLGATEGGHRLPPHARADAGTHDFEELEEALRGRRDGQVAVDDQGTPATAAHRRKMTLDDKGPAADRRVRDAGSRLTRARARPGRRPVPARRRARTRDRRTAWCRSTRRR